MKKFTPTGDKDLITKFQLQPTAFAKRRRVISLTTWTAVIILAAYILLVGRHSSTYVWDFSVIQTVLPVIGSAIWMTLALTVISLACHYSQGSLSPLRCFHPLLPCGELPTYLWRSYATRLCSYNWSGFSMHYRSCSAFIFLDSLPASLLLRQTQRLTWPTRSGLESNPSQKHR